MVGFRSGISNISHKTSGGLIVSLVAGLLVILGSLFFFISSAMKMSPTTPATSSSPAAPLGSAVKAPGKSAIYPTHSNITATVFWVGEGADSSNDFIHNRASAWMDDWVSAFGGIDNPDKRCGHVPCDFTPSENTFYFALPFSDYDERGLKPASELKVIPWYDGKIAKDASVLKNRWIKVVHDKKTAYGQWEDVGPFGEDDAKYVFGSATPKESRAGLDLSPAFANELNIDGRAVVSWNFIDEKDVPAGPWKNVITRSAPKYDS